MSERVSETFLRAQIRRIAEEFGLPNPEKIWRRVGNQNVAVVGAITLDIAYGGYRLVQIVNEGGGERDLSGRMSKAELSEGLRMASELLAAKRRMTGDLAPVLDLSGRESGRGSGRYCVTYLDGRTIECFTSKAAAISFAKKTAKAEQVRLKVIDSA